MRKKKNLSEPSDWIPIKVPKYKNPKTPKTRAATKQAYLPIYK